MTKTFSDRAVELIESLQWHFDDSKVNVYADLMVEYFKRSAAWAKALNAEDLWPFFDVATHLRPSLLLADGHESRIETALDAAPVSNTVKRTCLWYLKWETTREVSAEAINRLGLADPYAPLLDMYRLGGSFETEHGFVYIGLAGLPYRARGIAFYS